MHNLASKQSTVRTDFTLNYYEFEEMLAQEQTLLFTGRDHLVFLRSWIHYSEAKNESVIYWDEGDFTHFLSLAGQALKALLPNQELFTQYLDQQKDRLLTIIVEMEKVTKEHLRTLITLRNADSGASFRLVLVDLSVSTNSKTQQVSLVSEQAISVFSLPEVVKKPAKAETKSSHAGLLSALVVTVMVAGAGYVWLNKDNFFSGSIGTVSGEPDALESTSLEANQSVPEDSAATAQAQPLDAGVEQIVQSEPQAVVLDATSEDASVTQAGAPILETTPASAEPVMEQVDAEVQPAQTSEQNVVEVTEPQPLTANADAPQKMVTSHTSVMTVSAESTSPVLQETSSGIKAQLGAQVIASVDAGGQPVDVSPEQSVEQELDRFVQQWMAAWQGKNFSAYKEAYIEDYQSPKHRSYNAWVKNRKSRIAKPQWIKLKKEAFSVEPKLEMHTYRTQFDLHYSTPTYRDITKKQLDILRTTQGFKIIAEENLSVKKQ